MATVWPGLASSRSGGPATGSRIAVCKAAIGSAAARACTGCTTVVRSSGRSTRSPSSPYASQTSIGLRLVVSLPVMEAGLTGPHAATAAELKDRLAAERCGHPFLIMRGEDAAQILVELPEAGPSTWTIGRAAECDIAMPWDAQVSRVHAELV